MDAYLSYTHTYVLIFMLTFFVCDVNDININYRKGSINFNYILYDT